ncbi:MAG: hypothetical protein K9H16_11115 [Bacteroidales bacterium]|nr:hypothetical protein [Bacteroidales bacterium]
MLRAIKFTLLFLGLFTTLAVHAQQYLVVQKWGSVKNYKYEVGDELSFQTKNGDFFVKGIISGLNDSSLTLDNHYDVKLNNISKVFRTRHFLKGLSGLFFIRGGVAYVAIVGLNGVIHNESPMIDEQTLIISAGMIAIGVAMKPFIVKKMAIPEKWQLKVLDFNNLEGEW